MADTTKNPNNAPGPASAPGPAPDWSREREEWEDSRYDNLARRVERLEKRGMVLAAASDERLYLILFGAYVLFAYVIPLARDLFGKPEGE